MTDPDGSDVGAIRDFIQVSWKSFVMVYSQILNQIQSSTYHEVGWFMQCSQHGWVLSAEILVDSDEKNLAYH